MAHGRTGPDIVANIRYVGASEVRSVSQHERHRTPDGASAIDPERTHLNKVLIGPETQQEALEALWASGVKRPAQQAESPYVQFVLSASSSYFRSERQGPGEWDPERLAEWQDATLTWLTVEYGPDLVHASLHLDEDTPHIHALVVPTYQKKARKPGRKKRGETDEAFEARKAEAEMAQAVRSAGRSSSEQWSRPFARRHSRKSYHMAVECLGLGYGRDFVEEGQPSPGSLTTGQWVRQRSAELAAIGPKAETEAAAILDAAALNAHQMKLDAEAEAQSIFATAAAEAKARAQAFSSLAEMFENRTLKAGNTSPLKPGLPEIMPAAAALIKAQREEIARVAVLDARASELKRREDALFEREAEIEADLLEIRQHRDWLSGMRETMAGYLDRLSGWLRRSDLPDPARDLAHELVGEGDDIHKDILSRGRRLEAHLLAMRQRAQAQPVEPQQELTEDSYGPSR